MNYPLFFSNHARILPLECTLSLSQYKEEPSQLWKTAVKLTAESTSILKKNGANALIQRSYGVCTRIRLHVTKQLSRPDDSAVEIVSLIVSDFGFALLPNFMRPLTSFMLRIWTRQWYIWYFGKTPNARIKHLPKIPNQMCRFVSSMSFAVEPPWSDHPTITGNSSEPGGVRLEATDNTSSPPNPP